MGSNFSDTLKREYQIQSTDSPTHRPPKGARIQAQVASSNCLYDLVCHFLPGLHREKVKPQKQGIVVAILPRFMKN